MFLLSGWFGGGLFAVLNKLLQLSDLSFFIYILGEWIYGWYIFSGYFHLYTQIIKHFPYKINSEASQLAGLKDVKKKKKFKISPDFFKSIFFFFLGLLHHLKKKLDFKKFYRSTVYFSEQMIHGKWIIIPAEMIKQFFFCNAIMLTFVFNSVFENWFKSKKPG